MNEIITIIIEGIKALAFIGLMLIIAWTILILYAIKKFFKAPPTQRTWIISFGILLTVLLLSIIIPDPATPYLEIILSAVTYLTGNKALGGK